MKAQRKWKYIQKTRTQQKTCHLKGNNSNIFNTMYKSRIFPLNFKLCAIQKKGEEQTHTSEYCK
jgi:hypothetical protein